MRSHLLPAISNLWRFEVEERVRIGKEIEKAMRLKKLTLQSLSEQTGVPKSTIHRWIVGEVPCSVVYWLKLKNKLINTDPS